MTLCTRLGKPELSDVLQISAICHFFEILIPFAVAEGGIQIRLVLPGILMEGPFVAL